MFAVGVLNSMIEEYPDFSALALEQRPWLHPRFQRLPDGMSELTFAGLYLFRAAHQYRVAQIGQEVLIITGRDAEPFFILPFQLPPGDILNALFDRYRTMKAVSSSQAEQLSRLGCRVWEDRDNVDYLYSREKLATLSGRRLHRKKNLVNLFLRNNVCTAKPLLEEYVGDAQRVLEQWRMQQETLAAANPPAAGRKLQSGSPGDYAAAKEALEHMEYLQLCGGVFYVDDEPVAYTLGEELARGRMFVVHFEKAVLNKKHAGIYQYVNDVVEVEAAEDHHENHKAGDQPVPLASRRGSAFCPRSTSSSSLSHVSIARASFLHPEPLPPAARVPNPPESPYAAGATRFIDFPFVDTYMPWSVPSQEKNVPISPCLTDRHQPPGTAPGRADENWACLAQRAFRQICRDALGFGRARVSCPRCGTMGRMPHATAERVCENPAQ
ncbi:MAG: DUF2156 domain-containing protein [Planctomycetes bacterium]|nr:DUF2156 domain-containing protein [Planctomycetota bacterium]